MTYFVDANVFLRALVKENERLFNESVSFLSLIKKGKISAITSSIVLAEVAWTLSRFYKFPKKRVAQALKSIVNLNGLKLRDGSDVVLAIGLFEKFNVKFIDVLIASDPGFMGRNITLVSYDKDFDKLGVKRIEPGKLIKKKK